MADVFAECRPRLMGVAYGMLGELTEAEDVVQDAWLRWDQADRSAVRNAEAFLVTTTTRLALDRLRSARVRRETYVGPWLPEPLVTGVEEGPEALAIEAERLSLALLGALERLNPVERAVLVLRDAFDLEYAEIADAVEKSPANVRQIAKRAREHAGDSTRRQPVSAEEEQRLVEAFSAAAFGGDIEALQNVLAADAIMYSDGGGVVNAARKPIYGAAKVARFVIKVQNKKDFPTDVVYTGVRVNGEPGMRMNLPDGTFIGLMSLELAGGGVNAVRFFTNPERFS